MFVVIALYKFVDLPDCHAWQQSLQQLCEKQGVKGTLLLAAEGINGTIAGTSTGVDAVIAHLRADERFSDLQYKQSFSDEMPFARLKVRIKPEIVTMGCPEARPTEIVGTYVSPEAWNELIADPQVKVIDTRNDYEVEIGTFAGAINPGIAQFREFPQYVSEQLDPSRDKKIAMFCTGGIRCEKATSYLRQCGYEEVYHLEGGILKYLEKIPPEQSTWQGECFVFDERVAVGHGLKPGTHRLCRACGNPVSRDDMQHSHYIENKSCPKCFDR